MKNNITNKTTRVFLVSLLLVAPAHGMNSDTISDFLSNRWVTFAGGVVLGGAFVFKSFQQEKKERERIKRNMISLIDLVRQAPFVGLEIIQQEDKTKMKCTNKLFEPAVRAGVLEKIENDGQKLVRIKKEYLKDRDKNS